MDPKTRSGSARQDRPIVVECRTRPRGAGALCPPRSGGSGPCGLDDRTRASGPTDVVADCVYRINSMRVNREDFLRILESVSPGLATKESIEQSSCFAFKDGTVYTFNDEVACRRESPLNITGAIKAKPVLDLLAKMTEDVVEIEVVDKELRIKGKRRRSGIRLEEKFTLPIESIQDPETWNELHVDFNEAVKICNSCASKDESKFDLTCIHITPDCIESCDQFQIARYKLETGLENAILIRAESLKTILGLDMTEISETSSWVHFRNPSGLILSCRRFEDDYPNLNKFLTAAGTNPVTLPGGLDEVLSRAEIFTNDNASGGNVKVSLKPDKILIKGIGSFGWYEEMKTVTYDGEPIQFLIAPKLLLEVAKKSNDCRVDQNRLFIDTGKFVYTTSTVNPDEAESESES